MSFSPGAPTPARRSGNGGGDKTPSIAPYRLVFDVQRFRGGLVFKAHRRLYHSTLGVRVRQPKTKVSVKCLSVSVFQRVRGAVHCEPGFLPKSTPTETVHLRK